jgi:hypothetical protein
MLVESNELSSLLTKYLTFGTLWGIITFFIGFYIIEGMKRAYLKEIMIVSFLNAEMISKNKRV